MGNFFSKKNDVNLNDNNKIDLSVFAHNKLKPEHKFKSNKQKRNCLIKDFSDRSNSSLENCNFNEDVLVDITATSKTSPAYSSDNDEDKENISEIKKLINLCKNSNTNSLTSNIIVRPRLTSIKHELELLDSLVGLKKIKNYLADEILFMLTNGPHKEQMFNFIITGSIGSGKSYLGKLIARIIFKCLIRESDPLNNMLIVNKNLILSNFPSETVTRTKQILKNAKVLLIDDFDNYEVHDNMQNIRECINTISTEKTNTICIITTNMDPKLLLTTPSIKYFFRNILEIPAYTHDEYLEIFIKKISPITCDINACTLFKELSSEYVQNCNDVELISIYAKSVAAKRFINMITNNKIKEEQIIIEDDIRKAFEKLWSFKKIKTSYDAVIQDNEGLMYM